MCGYRESCEQNRKINRFFKHIPKFDWLLYFQPIAKVKVKFFLPIPV